MLPPALPLVALVLLCAPPCSSAEAPDVGPPAPPAAAPKAMPPLDPRARRPPDSLSALLTARASRPARPFPVTSFTASGSQQPKADAFINEVTGLLTGMAAKSIKSPGQATGASGGLNVVITPPLFPAEESWPGSCRLRSKRYVSDGLCMSPRPLTEVVCANTCVMNAWTKGGSRPLPWRCSDAGWLRKRVKLVCQDGSTRAYRIRVVQSCRCAPRRPRRGQGHDDQDQDQHEHDQDPLRDVRRSLGAGLGQGHRRGGSASSPFLSR